jgi:hypothetical protein
MFPLNEYSEGEIKRLIDQFSEEADDLNIDITDEQLRKYIERFDQLKNSPNITEKDLRKYSLSKLIKIVTAGKGAENPEIENNTPDVVYDDNGLVIYNGAKEDNCLTYGQGEKWCITRGSFGNYRYSSDKKNPTFYLVRDTNLSDKDPKSFFVVVVGNDGTYKVSDRTNNDVGHGASEWARWEPFSFVEQNFPSIVGLKNIFKYIPLSSKEKLSQTYKNNPLSVREWATLPYSVKEQYLVVRSERGGDIFKDISNTEFLSKVLPKYSQLAKFVATNTGIFDSIELLKTINNFSGADQRSIIANLRDTLTTKYLPLDTLPFNIKKLLVSANKWDLKTNERLYITQDGNTIVKLTLGNDIKMGLYTDEDDYPNVKLNKRTSKYLSEYPDLDKIPFKNLMDLASEGIIDKSLIDKIIEKAKNDPDSAIIIKNIDGTDIVLDSNSFKSYKLEGDKIVDIPFDSEEVQQILSSEEGNSSFQDNAVNLVKDGLLTSRGIPEIVDKETLLSIINATPFDKRKTTYDDAPHVVLTSPISNALFLMPAQPDNFNKLFAPLSTEGDNWNTIRDYRYKFDMTPDMIESYYAYLRNENETIPSDVLFNTLKNNQYANTDTKKAIISQNPPVDNDGQYAFVMNGNTALIINKSEPRNSFKISDQSGKVVKANVPSSLARILINRNAPQVQATQGGEPAQARAATRVAQGAGDQEQVPTTRRGRPVGGGAPRAQGQAGDISVSGVLEAAGLDTAFGNLPGGVYLRLNVNDARQLPIANDRGASRRNNMLGNAGRVVRILATPGGSSIYIIRLANDQLIASVVVQPGNRHYILTGEENGNNVISLDSPAQLMQALQQRNLAENIKHTIAKMYLAENPTMLGETVNLLKKHLKK